MSYVGGLLCADFVEQRKEVICEGGEGSITKRVEVRR